MLKKVQKASRKLVSKLSNAALFLFVLPSVCHADGTTATVGSVIDKATEYLQGGLARSVGVAAIVIAGYLCIAKQMFPKMYFMMILIGLGFIFGASTLYSTFVG